ncbi:MAG: hypothetical protein EOO50_12290 [Flavobacterium sp.]|uniref:hypothetical protein n=1 Tax=Flavobacterium sp. TaxID=239 RepID=UPI00122A0FEF|nr:hypothetical protein [Flavobacterium sp.]RZJ65788.1 MAG: hypothetical protein EOO50_12290 [Flavobacterium sp.]
MKNFFVCVAILVASISFAQIRFEPGYYLNAQNAKVEGLIRNVDWQQNPKSIEFRANEQADIEKISENDLQGFSVGETIYTKFTVDVDQSSRDNDRLSVNKNPEWKSETILLKVLVTGDLALYSYVVGNEYRFFMSVAPHVKPEQLVYKQYLSDNNTIAKNTFFRPQLFTAMRAKNYPSSTFEKLDYSQQDLLPLFQKYNGVEIASEKQKKAKGSLNLKVVAGAYLSKLSARYKFFTVEDMDFGNKTVPVFGIEGEYVLPFNKNKWSFFAAPTFQSYKGETTVGDDKATAEYRFIEIPIGVRHYFYLTDNSRLFLNVGFSFSTQLSGSEIVYPQQFSDQSVPLTRASSVLAGIGFSAKRLSVEFRLNTKRDLVNFLNWSGDYTSYGVLLSYKIL